MTDHEAIEALKGLMPRLVLPIPYAEAHGALTIISAGLQERDAFRDRIAALEAASEAKAAPESPQDPDARTLPFKATASMKTTKGRADK
jgi:hypothetical protein